MPHAHNNSKPAGRVLRVKSMDHGHQVVGVHLVADFDTNRVANASHELHMGSVKLPCTLATPQEMACKAETVL